MFPPAAVTLGLVALKLSKLGGLKGANAERRSAMWNLPVSGHARGDLQSLPTRVLDFSVSHTSMSLSEDCTAPKGLDPVERRFPFLTSGKASGEMGGGAENLLGLGVERDDFLRRFAMGLWSFPTDPVEGSVSSGVSPPLL